MSLESIPRERPAVRHNVAAHRFETDAGVELAYAEYEMANGRMALTHTWVPVEGRGKGLAAIVVEAALEYAQVNGLKVDPVCSYVQSFIARHPKYAGLAGGSSR
ncbi:MAG TPA: GNAT family N-acetyltransferase [Chthoniobacterales bacterium]